MAFVQAIGEAYGPESALELWDKIFSVLDPDIKGQVLMNMLTGEFNSKYITMPQQDLPSPSALVSAIKAVRQVTHTGLKEAKDLVQMLPYGSVRISLNADIGRQEAYNILRYGGLYYR